MVKFMKTTDLRLVAQLANLSFRENMTETFFHHAWNHADLK